MPKTPNLNREQQRVQIWTLRQQGLSWKKIATETKKLPQNCRKICQRITKTGSFKDQPRTGRPRKLDERKTRTIVDILQKSKVKTAEAVRKEASTHHNINVSANTIRRVLKRSGYVARVKRKKPLLTIEHKRKRLAWANEHRTWTVDEWKHVIWSDETAFTLVGSDGRVYNWVKDGDDNAVLEDDSVIPTKKFGGGKLMIWGCMTWEGVGYACKIDDILDAKLYCNILRGELMQTIDYFDMDLEEVIFQQDNDPKHVSHAAEETMEDLGLNVMKWPPQSPDLNPIEHLWRHLKRKLGEKKQVYSSMTELWESVEQELDVTNRALCQNLIASMPSRVQAVINAKGGYTKY